MKNLLLILLLLPAILFAQNPGEVTVLATGREAIEAAKLIQRKSEGLNIKKGDDEATSAARMILHSSGWVSFDNMCCGCGSLWVYVSREDDPNENGNYRYDVWLSSNSYDTLCQKVPTYASEVNVEVLDPETRGYVQPDLYTPQGGIIGKETSLHFTFYSEREILRVRVSWEDAVAYY